MDINTIMEYLPHRNQFLLVDKILEVSRDTIKAQKNVTMTEPPFLGHFPNRPIFPGVLIIECMTQTSGLLVRYGFQENPSKVEGYLTEVEHVKLYNRVIPGDVLIIESRRIGRVMNFMKFDCHVTADQKKIAAGKITLYLDIKQ